jgi:beta-phosphoglucomutase-like phosphatase (HAD superfamily)
MMIQAVIFDWAGTTIDYGSQAPIIAFQQAFHHFDIDIPTADIRQDLGLDKLTHVKKMMAQPEIQSDRGSGDPNVSAVPKRHCDRFGRNGQVETRR